MFSRQKLRTHNICKQSKISFIGEVKTLESEEITRLLSSKMFVTARAFNAVQNLNIGDLISQEIDPPYTEQEIRPFLSSLVRSSILDSANFDKTREWFEVRKQIRLILVESEIVNNIVALLQVNYNELEVDIKKEQQLR